MSAEDESFMAAEKGFIAPCNVEKRHLCLVFPSVQVKLKMKK